MYRFNTLLPLIAMIILLSLSSAYAIEPIPEESGFSGYLTLGGGYSHVKSNMIAGNAFGNVGNRTVDYLTDSPDSSSSGSVNVNFDLRYTFASTRTNSLSVMLWKMPCATISPPSWACPRNCPAKTWWRPVFSSSPFPLKSGRTPM